MKRPHIYLLAGLAICVVAMILVICKIEDTRKNRNTFSTTTLGEGISSFEANQQINRGIFESGRRQRTERKNLGVLARLEVPRGNNGWIEDTLRSWLNKADELPEGEILKLPSQDVQLILKLFHDQAGTSTGSDWDFWSGVIADLARLGVKSDSAAKLVLSRCDEMDQPQFNARWVLELYDLPEHREFVQERLGYLMGDDKIADAHRHECNNLFASLEPRDEASMKFIRQGATHESEKVREAAVFFADKLLPEEAVRILRAALSDSSESVRQYGIFRVGVICTKDDLEWLQKALRAETNEKNREWLEEEIDHLEREPESKREAEQAAPSAGDRPSN